MSCYFRHLKDLFAEAGVEVSAANKKQLDQAVHRLVDAEYKNCPVAWKKLKQEILADEQKRKDFISRLRETVT